MTSLDLEARGEIVSVRANLDKPGTATSRPLGSYERRAKQRRPSGVILDDRPCRSCRIGDLELQEGIELAKPEFDDLPARYVDPIMAQVFRIQRDINCAPGSKKLIERVCWRSERNDTEYDGEPHSSARDRIGLRESLVRN